MSTITVRPKDGPNAWFFRDRDRTAYDIVAQLWSEYIGHRDSAMTRIQTLVRLQESIRHCIRHETDSYSRGKATAGRVAETKGHAILVGKILAAYQ